MATSTLPRQQESATSHLKLVEESRPVQLHEDEFFELSDISCALDEATDVMARIDRGEMDLRAEGSGLFYAIRLLSARTEEILGSINQRHITRRD